MLTLRPTGLSSPAYRDWLDYVIVEDGRDVGRLYEDRHSKPELRWFWSITVYVNPMLGITTSGRAASIEDAKAQFLANWQRCRANSTPPARSTRRKAQVLSRSRCPRCYPQFRRFRASLTFGHRPHVLPGAGGKSRPAAHLISAGRGVVMRERGLPA